MEHLSETIATFNTVRCKKSDLQGLVTYWSVAVSCLQKLSTFDILENKRCTNTFASLINSVQEMKFPLNPGGYP